MIMRPAGCGTKLTFKVAMIHYKSYCLSRAHDCAGARCWSACVRAYLCIFSPAATAAAGQLAAPDPSGFEQPSAGRESIRPAGQKAIIVVKIMAA